MTDYRQFCFFLIGALAVLLYGYNHDLVETGATVFSVWFLGYCIANDGNLSEKQKKEWDQV